MLEEDEGILAIWDEGLADDEVFLLGKIVAHWGAIEHEIFNQTLNTFDAEAPEVAELPKEMNNLNFAKILNLWYERVVSLAAEPHRAILEKQKKNIELYQEYRNALVHGMLGWEAGKPEVFVSTRVKKKDIITIKFMEGDLYDFYKKLATINFNLRYPGGMEQLFMERMEKGFYFNEAQMRRIARRKK